MGTHSAKDFKALIEREPKKFYVYVLWCDKRPFYVGKGVKSLTRTRALVHEYEARHGRAKSPPSKFIEAALAQGKRIRYELAWSSNYEHHVLFHEQVLIGKYGRSTDGGSLVNLTLGGQGMSGYKLSAETCAKMSRTRKGRTQSIAHNAAISKGRRKSAKVKADNERRRVRVKIYGQVYSDIGEAASDLGVCRATLYWRLNRNWKDHERLT
jgi:hypothetical protein